MQNPVETFLWYVLCVNYLLQLNLTVCQNDFLDLFMCCLCLPLSPRRLGQPDRSASSVNFE